MHPSTWNVPYLGQSRAAGSDRVKCHGPLSFALHCMFGGLARDDSTFVCDARYIIHACLFAGAGHIQVTPSSHMAHYLRPAGQAFSPYPLGIPTQRPCMPSMGVAYNTSALGKHNIRRTVAECVHVRKELLGCHRLAADSCTSFSISLLFSVSRCDVVIPPPKVLCSRGEGGRTCMYVV